MSLLQSKSILQQLRKHSIYDVWISPVECSCAATQRPRGGINARTAWRHATFMAERNYNGNWAINRAGAGRTPPCLVRCLLIRFPTCFSVIKLFTKLKFTSVVSVPCTSLIVNYFENVIRPGYMDYLKMQTLIAWLIESSWVVVIKRLLNKDLVVYFKLDIEIVTLGSSEISLA